MTILSSLPALAAAASSTQGDLLSRIFVFDRYGELLHMLQNSIFAGAVLGLIGGFVGIFVMMRDHAFAVHGISEMSFAGAALALLLGYDVVTGSMVGSIASALLIAMIGSKASESNSVIGTLMPFGLGLGILFLSLYQGRSANKFGLLTGQIVSVDADQLNAMIIGAVVIIALLIIVWRPLSFASLDPDVARRSDALPLAGFHGCAGYRGGAVGAGGRFAAGAGPADYPGGGGDAGDGFSAAHAAAFSAFR